MSTAARVNILLVDDEPKNLVALDAVLAPLGENLVRATSGAEALRHVLESDFAAILLDVRMPSMSGFEAAKLIRARSRSKTTPIIFLTAADGSDLSAEEAYALGAVDYLSKPVVPAVLKAKVGFFAELYRKTEELKAAERRAAEAALREQKQLWQTTLASIGDGVIASDTNRRVTFLNAEAERLTGWSRAEAVGQNLDEVFRVLDRETRAPVRAPVGEALDSGRVTSAGPASGTVLVARDGTECPIDDSAAPIRDEAGRLFGVVFVFRDASEKYAAAKRLRESEARFRQLAETIPQLAWVAEPDGHIFWYNRRWYEYTGTTPEAMEGWGWQTVHDPVELPKVLDRWKRSIATGEPFDMVFPLRGADGAFRPFLTRVNPLLDEAGRVALWFGTNTDVSAQKRVESALRESEERHRTLADNLPAGFIYQVVHAADDSRRFSYVSGGVAAVFGVAPSEALADPLALYGLIVPEDRARVRADEDAAMRARAQFDCQFRIDVPGRGIKWVHCRSVPRVESGAGEVWDGVAVEVTAQKRAEERLQAVLASIDDHLVSYDREWRYTYVNDGAAAILGRPKEELLGRCIWDLFPDAVGNVYHRKLHEAAAAGRPVRFEHYYPPFERWFENHVYPSADGVTVYASDVTAQRRADEVLRRQAAIFENQTDAIIVTDPDGRILDWNPACERMLGYAKAEVLGKSTALFHRPEDAATLTRDALAATERDGVWRAEITFVRKDGTRGVCETVVKPLADDTGKVVGAVGVNRDVTDRKAAEEALKEANRRKDEFLAVLAHELRNPLAPIRNGLQVLRLAGNDRATAGKARDMMERQLGHMVRLIDDLLDVSRITRNKLDLRRERVTLADVVGSGVETARPAIDAAGHEFTVSLPAEDLFLDADLTRLAQVVSNLLTNATKYTPRGGRIALDGRRVGERVVVSVTDTGVGIPTADLPHVFDMFSQVDRSLERSTGGLGIGLALVKGLVEMHGGTVAAESAGAGQGSAFTVCLPATKSPAPSSTAGAALNGSPGAGPSRRILVVDDNRDAAASMREMLELLGHVVTTAHDGVEAVAEAEAFRPDVILMDVGMPKLNGYEATRRIRARPWAAATTVIALTGWGQDGDRRQSREAGCAGHLVKPVSLADLERALGELCRG